MGRRAPREVGAPAGVRRVGLELVVKTIVVGVDGSDTAGEALSLAAAEAEVHAAQLVWPSGRFPPARTVGDLPRSTT